MALRRTLSTKQRPQIHRYPDCADHTHHPLRRDKAIIVSLHTQVEVEQLRALAHIKERVAIDNVVREHSA
ncbi:hypothetical protein [Nitrobacter sp. JJSN]|uniref:hypothetical protein n=1 Tax=Nitrobacter sp. JJSN TaxID=3453033 RepID=UPI003F75B044